MYMMVSGDRAELRGLNLEGLRRCGFSDLEVRKSLLQLPYYVNSGACKTSASQFPENCMNAGKRGRMLANSIGMQVKSIRRTYQKLFMNSDTEAGGLEDRLATLVCLLTFQKAIL